jgi:hypothetical protein
MSKATKSAKVASTKKLKFHKDAYDPDWKAFAKDQGMPSQLSDHDWKRIRSRWVLSTDQEKLMRRGVTQALYAFIRLQTGYNNVKQYEEAIHRLAKRANEIIDLTLDLEKFNFQRLLIVSSALDLDSDLKHSVLNEAPLKGFCKVSFAFIDFLRDAIRSLEEAKAEPDKNEVFWLVRVIDKLVKTHVNPSGLSRSKSDIDVIIEIMKVAQRETGRSIKDSYATTAIRQLMDSRK